MTAPLVLVSSWSRHGSTREISHRIGAVLAEAGFRIDESGGAIPEPGRHDLVVLGSAVYAGQWLDAAMDYLHANAPVLAATRSVVFSSGLSGPSNALSALCRRRLRSCLPSAEHRYFYGRLDRGALDRKERMMVDLLGTPDADRRDWSEIERWALELAASIRPLPGRVAAGRSQQPGERSR